MGVVGQLVYLRGRDLSVVSIEDDRLLFFNLYPNGLLGKYDSVYLVLYSVRHRFRLSTLSQKFLRVILFFTSSISKTRVWNR